MKLPSESLHRPRGVTLLELMVAITVLAILAGIGIPAFSNLMRSNEIAAQANNLVSALVLARSEAMKRGVRVSVCPSKNGIECTEDWDDGWLVFSDDFGAAGVLEDIKNDEPIQRWMAPSEGVKVTANAASVVFMPSAALNTGSGRTFSITKNGCTQTQRRQVIVATTGRVSLKPMTCSEEEAEGS